MYYSWPLVQLHFVFPSLMYAKSKHRSGLNQGLESSNGNGHNFVLPKLHPHTIVGMHLDGLHAQEDMWFTDKIKFSML